jgi:hypothetical protein
MWGALGDEGEEPSYLEEGRIRPALVEHLFRCAARLYRAAPWSVAASDQLLRLDIPALGVEGACVSINGSEGEVAGILIFPSLEACETFVERAQEFPADGQPMELGAELLGLSFDRPADLPPRMLREANEYAWPLASSDAYPLVWAWHPEGVPRPLEERDVRIAAACAAGLASIATARAHRSHTRKRAKSCSPRAATG